MNTLAEKLTPVPMTDNIINVDFGKNTRRTTSIFKSNGAPKATAADPIRDPAAIKTIQEYFISHGQIRNYTMFTVGILFGLRAGDLLDLKIHHILNPDGTFKSHCDLIESKTRKFNNPVITPAIRGLISDYLETLPAYSLNDPLFQSRERNRDGSGKPITLRQWNHILKEAAKACDVPGHISSHSVRKTFAYQLLKQNPNDDNLKFALQKMLNHNDFKTTLTYCGMTQDALDAYRAGLEDVLC